MGLLPREGWTVAKWIMVVGSGTAVLVRGQRETGDHSPAKEKGGIFLEGKWTQKRF